MKAALLVGGLGTRLRSAVPSSPKALASVGGRPFLELLVSQLSRQKISQLVMCTGYLADQIKDAFGDGGDLRVAIEYSEELVPLGTGGALKLAQCYLQQESEFLVLNGDSFLEINFNELFDFHRRHDGLATMAVVPVENASRYGTVGVGSGGRISGFTEKTGQYLPGIINAGVYVFSSAVFAQIPEGQASLERDVFPELLKQGIYAFEQRGIFIDIGIPEDYARARQMCDRLTNAALLNH
jgi:NDP-sugar pyrophosphorylase family protein